MRLENHLYLLLEIPLGFSNLIKVKQDFLRVKQNTKLFKFHSLMGFFLNINGFRIFIFPHISIFQILCSRGIP